MAGSPALLRSALKCQPRRFVPLMVVPVVVGTFWRDYNATDESVIRPKYGDPWEAGSDKS